MALAAGPACAGGFLPPGEGDKLRPNSVIPRQPGPGAGRCKAQAGEDELTFQERHENPAKAVQVNVRPETNNMHFKICSYMIEWKAVGEKKNSDCSLDENHFTHWLEK